jgi:hypothetical protein
VVGFEVSADFEVSVGFVVSAGLEVLAGFEAPASGFWVFGGGFLAMVEVSRRFDAY